jgi:hypothetical protein
MQDYTDFWVVIGTAGPVVALAQLVVVNAVMSRPYQPARGSRSLLYLSFVSGLVGFFLATLSLVMALHDLAHVPDRGIRPTPGEGYYVIGFSVIAQFLSISFLGFADLIDPERKGSS